MTRVRSTLFGVALLLAVIAAVVVPVEPARATHALEQRLVLPVGGGPSSGSVEVDQDGVLEVSAAASGDPTQQRTISGSLDVADPAGTGDEGLHQIDAVAPVHLSAALSWQEGTRETTEAATGTVAAGGTETRTLVPTAPGPLSFQVQWSSVRLSETVTGTAAPIVPSGTTSSSSGGDSGTVDPGWFEVNGSGKITAELSWQESTVPLRDLNLYLDNHIPGHGRVAEAVTLGPDSPETLSYTTPWSVRYPSIGYYGLVVRNAGTESHDYQLHWEWPVTAELDVELHDPDGNVVATATGTDKPEVVSTVVEDADVGRPFTVVITSADYEAPYSGTWTYQEPALADLIFELVEQGGGVLAAVDDTDGAVDLARFVESAPGGLEWRVTNTSDATVPAYSIEETVTNLSAEEFSGGMDAGGQHVRTVPADAAGPLRVDLSWGTSSVPAQLTDAGTMPGNYTAWVESFRPSGGGLITGTLDWVEPTATDIASGSVDPVINTEYTRTVSVERKGVITARADGTVPPTSDYGPNPAGLILELVDQNGQVVASMHQGPDQHVSLSYSVPDGLAYPYDYTVRVTTDGLGDSFDLEVDYPVTADLDLRLWRSGTGYVGESADKPATITYQHTGGPTRYWWIVRANDDHAADWTLEGSYPTHAEVTLTASGPDGTVLDTVTDDDGKAALTTYADVSGGYDLTIVAADGSLDVPDYQLTALSPRGGPIDASVTVIDADGTAVGSVAAGETAGVPVTAGTYTIEATSDHTGHAVVDTQLHHSFALALSSPQGGRDWGTIELAAELVQDVVVDRVEFYVDGALVGTDEAAPFAVSWDSTTVADGLHAVEARAVADLDFEASAYGGVEVANGLSTPDRLVSDLDAGAITSEEYVRTLLDLVDVDVTMPARYGSDAGEGLTAALVRAAHELANVAEPALSELVDRFEFTSLTEQTSAGSVETSAMTASSTPTFNCEATPRRVLLQHESDCWAAFGEFVIHYMEVDAGPDGDGDGVPDFIEEVGEGYLEAIAAYGALGYSIPFTVDTLISADAPARAYSIPELNLPLGAGNAVANIVMNPATTEDPRYVAAHELFHSVQYGYIAGHLDSNQDILWAAATPTLNTYLWWMEASAEWAAHKWADAEQLAVDDPLRALYHSSLDAFLGDPSRALTGDPSILPALPSPLRNYGAFVVAEWMEDKHGEDAIRLAWQNGRPTKPAQVAIHEVVAGADAADTWVPTLWADIYHLDIATVGDAENGEWRNRLAETGAPFSSSARRMATEYIGALASGTSTNVGASIGAGGAKVIEFAPDAGVDVTIQVVGDEPGLHVEAQALGDYNLSPTSPPTLCAPATTTQTSATSWGITVSTPGDGSCKALALILTNTDIDSLSVLEAQATIKLGDLVDTTIEAGDVRLGIHPEAHLNVEGFDTSSGGTEYFGLRYAPTNADALAPGCLCEGWGVLDEVTSTSGWANEAAGGVAGLTVQEYEFEADRAKSQVRNGRLLVTHSFTPSTSPNLFEITVSVTNQPTPLQTAADPSLFGPAEVVYRRVMDWDVEPTAFSEYVTIDASGGALPPEIVAATNNGFEHPDPSFVPTDIGATGLFIDYGPTDQGALFDIALGEIGYGESTQFRMYYGAAGNEANALAAVTDVGATVWSFAQPNVDGGATTGEPNTFIWAYKPR